MSRLPKYEIVLYFIIYLAIIFYGVANVYWIRNKLVTSSHYGFTDGWSVIGRKRDDSNVEWENFKYYLWKNISWYITHISLAEICRFWGPSLIPFAHTLVGLAYILSTYQTQTILIIFCQLLSFFAISHFERKSVVWILAFIWIAVINLIKNSHSLYRPNSYVQYYELIVVLSWCILKCLSFSLSRFECRSSVGFLKSYNFVNYCGYCLYFPTLVYGPFMIYDRYSRCLDGANTTVRDLGARGKVLLLNLVRIIAWLLFIDFSLHFLYVSYMEQNVEIVKSLASWTLYGFGYLMGQTFHCQYVVLYGIGISLAKFESMKPPLQPKCIGRIHFYSDMWKYFDQGLYEFLFLYIYTSLCKRTCSQCRKLFASCVTFLFIFLWHGFFDYVLVWSLLNFMCLSIEKLFRDFVKTSTYDKMVAKNFNSRNQNRIYAVMAAQILMSSSISNIYFFAGIDVGNYFLQQTYQSGILTYLGLSIGFYCIFQSAKFINECNTFDMHSKNM